jgi:predicted nucleic-acid-binding Zn-ribbon protein
MDDFSQGAFVQLTEFIRIDCLNWGYQQFHNVVNKCTKRVLSRLNVYHFKYI